MTQYPQVFTPPQPSASRSWWKKKRYTMPGVALAGIVAIGAFAGPPEKKPIAAAPSAIASTSAPATLAPQTTAASPAPTPVATTEPSAPATIQGLAAAPAPTPAKPATVAPKPAPAKTAAPKPAAKDYYKNCAEARAAGVAPIYKGQPGYRAGLDGDKDGIACE